MVGSQKLKPFFPPLDQMQSLNLRAALLRALEQAKQNGVLGRDSAIRKTMLDECKGERLEDVLAYFSTAVLKKAVADADAANEDHHPAVATELALENKGYKGDDAELGALVLAHRASLRRILERKQVARSQFRDFADLLSVMERRVARRNEVVRAHEENGSSETVSENAREEMRRTVRGNWPGNERWMQTLLLGDSCDKGSGLLAMPFDRVWRRVQQGRLAELEEDKGGLLEQLESRVKVQKERLARWNAFRNEMMEYETASSPSRSKTQGGGKATKGIDLSLGGHQDLHFLPATQTTGIGRKDPPLMEEYGDLVNGLRANLAQIRNPTSKTTGFLALHRRRSLDGGEEGAVSDISELEDELESEEVAPGQLPAEAFKERVELARRLPVRPKLSQLEESQHSPTIDPSRAVTAREASTAPQLLDHDAEILDASSRRSLWTPLRRPARRPGARQYAGRQHLPQSPRLRIYSVHPRRRNNSQIRFSHP